MTGIAEQDEGGFQVRLSKECLDRVLELMDEIEAKERELGAEEAAIEAVLLPKRGEQ